MSRLFLAGLFFAAFIPETAAQSLVVVYPTGQYPADVQNVKAALDGGGVILLKATTSTGVPTAFNFGPPVVGPGFVDVRRDSELVGERTSIGKTTIEGGWYPIQGFASVTAAVRDIDFHSPLDGAILFVGPPTADTAITGNHVTHVIGRFRTPTRTFGEAIVVSGGRVVIDDNVIEDVDAFNGSGISEFRSAGPVEILRNMISGTTNHAIEATANEQAVRIEGNVLRPGLSCCAGFGIEVNGTGAYTIQWNDILVESPVGIGIWAFGALGFGFGAVTSPVIARNHVVLSPVGTIGGQLFNDGIDLAGLVSSAYVGQNQIEGPGFSAFSLFALSFDPATQPSDLGFNTFVGNNIARVKAQVADVFLDVPTHDNVLVGSSGTVLDLGTRNSITGFTSGGQPGTGLQVSEAVRLRNLAAYEAVDASLTRRR
jgi:hypothetical protein